MATVRFTRHLQRWFPGLAACEVEAADVAALVAALDEQHPGLAAYLVDEAGRLRPHVNVFVGDEMLRDRQALSDPLEPGDEVTVMQALSGG